MEDVVMTDSTNAQPATVTETTGIYLEYRKALQTIEKAIALKDTKTLNLIFKLLNKFRKGLQDNDLSYLCDLFLRDKFPFMFVPELDASTKDAIASKFNLPPKFVARLKESPEIFVYNFLLVLLKLVDKKLFSEANESLQFLVKYIKQNESVTIQYLRAKTYYYLALVAEKSGRYGEIINEFHSAFRKSCLDLDEITQVTLINCIVRYYLNNNAVEHARNFISKTKFHENVSTNEDARYWFYLGRIEAIQMNYSEAYKHLTNSLRKAPEKCGDGFKLVVEKLLIIVQLLMGEVPDIKTFFAQNLSRDLRPMKPYLDLIKAVKQGNLDEYKAVVNNYGNVFDRDRNFTLIQRIRYVVIKIGLRKINLSYSRISLANITEKLKLESDKETEYIIAKAIRDGVFLAKINHDEGYVQSLVK